jgi:hypothetical protein
MLACHRNSFVIQYVGKHETEGDLLNLAADDNNDASAPPPIFAGAGDQLPFGADHSNRDNGPIYSANQPSATGAKESAGMDFRHEDCADPQKLNVILLCAGQRVQPTKSTFTGCGMMPRSCPSSSNLRIACLPSSP